MSLTVKLSDNIDEFEAIVTGRKIKELRDAWIEHIKTELDFIKSISNQAMVHIKNVIKASHVLEDIYEMAANFAHKDKEYNMTKYTDRLLANI